VIFSLVHTASAAISFLPVTEAFLLIDYVVSIFCSELNRVSIGTSVIFFLNPAKLLCNKQPSLAFLKTRKLKIPIRMEGIRVCH
jgi:hypothetical protein